MESLGEVERIVVASPDLIEAYGKPKTPQDLSDMPCVSLEPFEGGRIPLIDEKGKAVVVSPLVKMATNSIFALRQAALAGMGTAILPRWFTTDELKTQRLIDFLPQWYAPKLTIHVASRSGRY